MSQVENLLMCTGGIIHSLHCMIHIQILYHKYKITVQECKLDFTNEFIKPYEHCVIHDLSSLLGTQMIIALANIQELNVNLR